MPMDEFKHRRVESWRLEVAMAGPLAPSCVGPAAAALSAAPETTARTSVQRFWTKLLRRRTMPLLLRKTTTDRYFGDADSEKAARVEDILPDTALYCINVPAADARKLAAHVDPQLPSAAAAAAAATLRDPLALKDKHDSGAALPDVDALKMANATHELDLDLLPDSQDSSMSKLDARRERLERAARLLNKTTAA